MKGQVLAGLGPRTPWPQPGSCWREPARSACVRGAAGVGSGGTPSPARRLCGRGEVGPVWHRVGQDGGRPCRDGGSSSSVDGVVRWLFPCGLRESGCEECLLQVLTRVLDTCICFPPVSGGKGLRTCQIAPAFEVPGGSRGKGEGCLDKSSL